MRARRSSGREFAALIGGVAVGVAGSTLLPPILAMVSGRMRGGADPFALLIQDHRRILSILDRMQFAPGGGTLRRAGLFLMLKRKLAKHAMAEEDVVYPELHAQQDQADRSMHLYDEHAEMKIRLFQLEELVRSGGDWREQVRSLRELVQRHADEEEQNIFPRLRNAMTENRRPRISGQIHREEAMVH